MATFFKLFANQVKAASVDRLGARKEDKEILYSLFALNYPTAAALR